MSQITALITALKKQLKAHGLTYADIAQLLTLSEASVKRLFAEQHFTLQRIEVICEAMGLELSELMQLATQQQLKLQRLNQAQEQEIVSDPLLLLITVHVINGLTLADILHKYALTEPECIRRLVQLDRLKLIELLPNNRIKLRIAPNFSWIPNGPIQQFFHRTFEKDFFRSNFDQENEALLVLNGLLSNRAIDEIQKKMNRLASEFNTLIKEDFPLTVDEKTGVTTILAIRPWEYSLFDQYSKQPPVPIKE